MKKQTKNLISLGVVLVVLSVLAGVYLWQLDQQRKAEAAATPAPSTDTSALLIDYPNNELETAVFTQAGQTLTLESLNKTATSNTSVEWRVTEEPNVPLNQTSARDMARGLQYLLVDSKLQDSVSDLAEYGLGADALVAVGQYQDGSEITVRVGKMTSNKDRYYLMIDGDPALYLLDTYYGDRFFYDINTLIDRSLPILDATVMEYVLVKERGKQPIEFGFYGTDEELQAMKDAYGMIYMTMLQPYPGREIYFSNFENYALTEFGEFTFGDIAELHPESLSDYGLDDPSLELWFQDQENEMHLLFGDDAGEDLVYCKYYDRDTVFIAEKRFLNSLTNINPVRFIERFVAMVDIRNCTGITIETHITPTVRYEMAIEHGVLPPEAGETEGEETIKPTVNKQPVQDLAFRTFYRYLLSISYDVEIEPFTPTTEPAVLITYQLQDKEPLELKFYVYDENFFAVERDGNPIQFIANRQAVTIMLESVTDLLAGRLDRAQ